MIFLPNTRNKPMKKHTTTMLAAFVAAASILIIPALRAHEGHEHKDKKTPKTTEPAKPAKPAKPGVKPYTLTTCIVSDDKLGEMGKPVVFEYKGQEIKLCCKGCRKDFDKDPARFLKKLEPKK